MQAKRILVPTDFSRTSESALSLAIDLADGHGDTSIDLIHVVEATIPGYDEELGVLEPEALRTEMEMLAAARGHDVKIDAQVIHGDASKKIIDFAEEHGNDLIIMGTHGRKGFVQMIMGSTAESVMRNANCPVVTVRDDSAIAEKNRKTRRKSG